MKKITVLLLLLCSFTLCKGQIMSDKQLIKEAVAAKRVGVSESEIATQLMKKTTTPMISSKHSSNSLQTIKTSLKNSQSEEEKLRYNEYEINVDNQQTCCSKNCRRCWCRLDFPRYGSHRQGFQTEWVGHSSEPSYYR